MILSSFFDEEIFVISLDSVCSLYAFAAGDHGVKAQGDGWLMTVTLIEGENLSPTEESSYANPYVVFTCSGKRRTSSVKLRTLKPRWRGKLSYKLIPLFIYFWVPTCTA